MSESQGGMSKNAVLPNNSAILENRLEWQIAINQLLITVFFSRFKLCDHDNILCPVDMVVLDQS